LTSIGSTRIFAFNALLKRDHANATKHDGVNDKVRDMTAPLDSPQLMWGGKPLDMGSESIGQLRSSVDVADDRDELHRRMASDGYLFLPGYLDREQVMAARMSSLERLAEKGIFEDGFPLEEAILKPGQVLRSAQDVPIGNEPLLELLYSGRMIEFYEHFLGASVMHFDYTWFRSKSAASEAVSDPHCDVVYMSRGETRNRYTSWTPLGDVPLGMGGLMILEGSHLHEELKETYGQTDVDVYCENVGDAAQIMAAAKAQNRELTAAEKDQITWSTMGAYCHSATEAREQVGGRWLTSAYEMGDLLLFTMYTMHTGSDNQTDRLRISTDTRYQPASDAVDERWVGAAPGNWDIRVKQGMVC